MENYLELLLGGFLTLIPVSIIIAKKYVAEYMIDIIKDVFKSKTDKEANLILKGFTIAFLVIGISLMSYAIINEEQEEQKEEPLPKTETEMYIEAAETAADMLIDGLDKRNKRDSIIISKRKQRFVYQIGDKIDNKKSVFKLYKQLVEQPNIDISNIYVFKKSRKTYYLIKDNSYTKAQIEDSLYSFKSRINTFETNVQVIDLVKKFCNAKETISNTEPLKYRKEDFTIPCKISDK